MRTIIITIAMVLSSTYMFAQWQTFGNAVVPGQFLGSTNNQFLDFRTNGINRMTILGADNLLNSPQFATEKAGNVGIGTHHPLTLLHLGGEGSSVGGWRDWMDIGTYYASRGGYDNMYVGLRKISLDKHEAIINFGNNPSINPGNGDLLRFVFTAATGNGRASTNDGFELARMWVDGQDNGRMGIGDFFTAGIQPQNSLEIMASESSPYWNQPGGASGLRFTHLTSDSMTTTNPGKGLLAVDENGDVIYVNPSTGGSGDLDCRWEDINSATIAGEKDMITANDPSEECYRGKIGIGLSGIKLAKLNVVNEFSRDKVLIGIYGESDVTEGDMNTYVIGVSGKGHNNGVCCIPTVNVGLQGEGRDSRYVVGVNGLAVGNIDEATTGISIGVRGIAQGAITHNIGVYGEVYTPGNPGYFVGGNVVLTGNTVIISDESVKNTIEPMENASSLLNNLQPKTYYYQSPENREIAFDQQLQYGFLAQEVIDVIPDIVKETIVPELMDSTGVIEGSEVDLLGIKYEALIPILVAGFQEQNELIIDQAAQLANQNETIANLETQLQAQASQLEEMQNDMQSVLAAVQTMQQKNVNCCTPKTESDETGMLINENQKGLELQQNVPNPFDDQTRIVFKLPNAAAVILEITDATGRPLQRLIDGTLDKGEHTTLWDGSKVPSGIYFYTLYADGQLLTKKMIKR